MAGAVLVGILMGLFIQISLDSATVVEAKNEAVEEQPQEVRIEVVWSKDEIEKEIRRVFHEEPNTAVAVAWAESELVAWAENPEAHRGCYGSFGIMQVACVHHREEPQALKDIQFNLQKARAVYDDSRARTGNGWLPWGAYTDGRYKEYLR